MGEAQSHVVSDVVDIALVNFNNRYPKVTIDITLDRGPSTIEKVVNRSINFGIGIVGHKSPELNYLHLHREYFAFYCGPRHRFFWKRGLSVKDLSGESAVAFKMFTNSEALQTITGLYHQANLALPYAGVSDNLEEIRRMIVAGIGIGAMPMHAVQRDIRDGQLWQLPPYERPSPIDVYLITSPKAQLNRVEQAFVAELKAITEAMPLSKRTYPEKFADLPHAKKSRLFSQNDG